MMDRFTPFVTEEEIRIEKQKARLLKKTSWWRKKTAKRTCYYCGKEVSRNELTMDHIVPLIRGGKSIKSNIVTACKECNNNKKYLLPFEWEQYLQSLNSSDPEKIL